MLRRAAEAALDSVHSKRGRVLTRPTADRAGSPTAEGNNISATPFDLSTGNFPYPGASSIGPSTPPAHVDSNNPHAQAAGMDMHLFEWNNPGNEMWYLPTGPAFFQNMENSSVAMTAEGVNVGGLDLLEYMAMDPVQFSGIEGPASAGGANANGNNATSSGGGSGNA